jgi:D,D-heptose 1,7-bisphosphate phosphatase
MLTSQIVFLVGGKGSRLGSLTALTPKPLLDVGGRPFLDSLIENAARFGLKKVILLAGHLGDAVSERYQNWGMARGIEIRCIIEPEAAGTGGALLHAAEYLDDTFYLANGDSLFDINLLDLPLIEAPTGWIGKLALRRVLDGSRYGQVLTQGNRVTDLIERGPVGPALINGGVYLLRRDILNWMKTTPLSIERDVFPMLAKAGHLFSREFEGFFLDIGIPEDFSRAQEAIPTHLRRPAVFFDRDGVLNHDAGYIHRVKDFRWCDGAVAAIRHLNDLGFYVFVVTNQGGVARGYYSEDEVLFLHHWMNEDLAKVGAHIDAFYYCPHHPEGVDALYARICDCRKPAPGMIYAALRYWSVDLTSSVMIGDKSSDMEAARSAGLKGILWMGGDLHAWAKTLTEHKNG